MNYPIWEVALLGGGWVIGLIAIVHIYVSHFAIGTGFFLAYTEWKCYQRADSRTLAYVRHHSRFFCTHLLGYRGAHWRRHLVCHRLGAPDGYFGVDSPIRFCAGD